MGVVCERCNSRDVYGANPGDLGRQNIDGNKRWMDDNETVSLVCGLNPAEPH